MKVLEGSCPFVLIAGRCAMEKASGSKWRFILRGAQKQSFRTVSVQPAANSILGSYKQVLYDEQDRSFDIVNWVQ